MGIGNFPQVTVIATSYSPYSNSSRSLSLLCSNTSQFIHQSNTKNLVDPFSNVPHHGSAQSAMYSRELAQSSAMCCPLGCQQEKLDNMCIDGLLDEEAALLERVLMTSHNLKDSQIAAIMKANKERPSVVSHSSKKKKNGKKEYKRPSRKLTDEIQLTEVFDRIKHDKHNTPPPLTQRRGHAHHASMSMLGSTQKPPQGEGGELSLSLSLSLCF